MSPGQILKKLRPDNLTLEDLARRLNERCPGKTFDRIDAWKMENDQRHIPGDVLLAWFDVIGVPGAKRWETIAARLGLAVPALLSSLGLPVAEVAAAPNEAA